MGMSGAKKFTPPTTGKGRNERRLCRTCTDGGGLDDLRSGLTMTFGHVIESAREAGSIAVTSCAGSTAPTYLRRVDTEVGTVSWTLEATVSAYQTHRNPLLHRHFDAQNNGDNACFATALHDSVSITV
jgi:hypothetical protein